MAFRAGSSRKSTTSGLDLFRLWTQPLLRSFGGQAADSTRSVLCPQRIVPICSVRCHQRILSNAVSTAHSSRSFGYLRFPFHADAKKNEDSTHKYDLLPLSGLEERNQNLTKYLLAKLIGMYNITIKNMRMKL